MDRIENLIENLNHAQREVRLQAVRDLKQAVDHGDIPSVPRQDECITMCIPNILFLPTALLK